MAGSVSRDSVFPIFASVTLRSFCSSATLRATRIVGADIGANEGPRFAFHDFEKGQIRPYGDYFSHSFDPPLHGIAVTRMRPTECEKNSRGSPCRATGAGTGHATEGDAKGAL